MDLCLAKQSMCIFRGKIFEFHTKNNTEIQSLGWICLHSVPWLINHELKIGNHSSSTKDWIRFQSNLDEIIAYVYPPSLLSSGFRSFEVIVMCTPHSCPSSTFLSTLSVSRYHRLSASKGRLLYFVDQSSAVFSNNVFTGNLETMMKVFPTCRRIA